MLDDLEDPGLIDLHLPQSDLDLRYALAKIRNLVTILPDLGAELPDLAAKNPDVRTESGDIRTNNAHVRMNNAHLRMEERPRSSRMFTTSDRMSRINRNNDPVLFETAHCMPAISTPVAVNTTATITATSRRGNRAQTARPFCGCIFGTSGHPGSPFLSDFLLRGPDRRFRTAELPKARGSYRTPDGEFRPPGTVAPNSQGRRPDPDEGNAESS